VHVLMRRARPARYYRLTFVIESASLRAFRGSLDWLREFLRGWLFTCLKNPKTRPSSDDAWRDWWRVKCLSSEASGRVGR